MNSKKNMPFSAVTIRNPYPVRMSTVSSIIILFILSSCSRPFEEKILADPRFSSGRDETGVKIKPKVIQSGDYTFVIGFSDIGSSLGGYHLDREFFFDTGGDGFYDAIY